MIGYVGGFGGCGVGEVGKNVNGVNQPDTTAQVSINSTNLNFMDGMYMATGISTTPGTQYTLKVTEGGTTIATGTAIMPSTVTISSPMNKSTHAINTALTVTWSAIQYATSIIISVDFQDSVGNDTTIYSPTSLDPSQTSLVIPATVFSKSGTYVINVDGNYGIPPNLSAVDSTLKGYNISGPAGMFVAASEALDTVIVNTSSLSKNALKKKHAPSVKDQVLRVAQKWFPKIF
jgi:hypothetical protein